MRNNNTKLLAVLALLFSLQLIVNSIGDDAEDLPVFPPPYDPNAHMIATLDVIGSPIVAGNVIIHISGTVTPDYPGGKVQGTIVLPGGSVHPFEIDIVDNNKFEKNFNFLTGGVVPGTVIVHIAPADNPIWGMETETVEIDD